MSSVDATASSKKPATQALRTPAKRADTGVAKLSATPLADRLRGTFAELDDGEEQR